jgi:hypothetical protein
VSRGGSARPGFSLDFSSHGGRGTVRHSYGVVAYFGVLVVRRPRCEPIGYPTWLSHEKFRFCHKDLRGCNLEPEVPPQSLRCGLHASAARAAPHGTWRRFASNHGPHVGQIGFRILIRRLRHWRQCRHPRPSRAHQAPRCGALQGNAYRLLSHSPYIRPYGLSFKGKASPLRNRSGLTATARANRLAQEGVIALLDTQAQAPFERTREPGLRRRQTRPAYCLLLRRAGLNEAKFLRGVEDNSYIGVLGGF